MHEEPTAHRVPDPGVRALFAEASRYQAWLDVEAALAQAQAELGIIPAHAAKEINPLPAEQDGRRRRDTLLRRDGMMRGGQEKAC